MAVVVEMIAVVEESPAAVIAAVVEETTEVAAEMIGNHNMVEMNQKGRQVAPFWCGGLNPSYKTAGTL